MKKALFAALLVALTLLSACSSGSNGQPGKTEGNKSDGNKKLVVGVTYTTLRHEFFIDISKGVNKKAEEEGISVLSNDPNLDLSKQVSAIEDYMQKGVDALIVLATDNAGVIPAIEEAKSKGIPIITADNVVDSDSVDTFIGTENYEAGKLIGDQLKKKIEADGKEATIAIVTWKQSFVQKERLRGFKDALADVKGVKFLNEQPGYNREESMATVENIIQANPDVSYIFATSENSVTGSLAALESANKSNIQIVGFDPTPEAADGIRNGHIYALIQQQPQLIGEKAIEAALDAINGKQLEKNISIPVVLLDKSNVDEHFAK
ncbi:substrate-binding domain-containing protein [Paenibacillus pinihumi]|uniref:substrate-binding domain-containing protein n=1 Tax=Paenibacillus pinihumi TaxID=669462 RepID=UPI0004091229|nr:substrate-binding domain-containing protein [Paenibacillus pinihumi]